MTTETQRKLEQLQTAQAQLHKLRMSLVDSYNHQFDLRDEADSRNFTDLSEQDAAYLRGYLDAANCVQGHLMRLNDTIAALEASQ